MDSKTEGLPEIVGGQLHGDKGARDVRKFLKRVKPYIESSIFIDPKGEALSGLGKWLLDDPDGLKKNKLNRYLDLSLEIYSASEQESGISEAHFGLPGHDMENVIHPTTEVLRMIDTAGPNLGDYTKWELLISGLNENLGRLIEGDDYTHQTTGFLLARAAIRTLEADPDKATEEEKLIARRVMGSIYGHGDKNSGDPISDLIKQSNRLQLVEPRFFRRSLEYDVGQVDQGIISPIDPERQISLSHTTDEKPDKIPTSMDWGEFYLRNLFPFISDANKDNPDIYKRIMNKNQFIASIRRANSVTMLVILAGGEDTELFKQVFAPELKLIRPEETPHWTKQRIPEEIFQEGLKKYREFVQNPPQFPGLKGIDDKRQIAAMLQVMSSYLPKDLLEKIYKKYDKLGENEQRNVVYALRHSLYLHYEELDKELEMLGRQVEDSNPHVAKVAKFAKNYLGSKKRLDKPDEI